MDNNINFDILKKKYPKLYKTINEYYGIGTPAKYNIQELIYGAHNNKHYVSFWKEGILKKIAQEINLSVSSITFGFIPNYGGEVYFSTKQVSQRRYELIHVQFYLSLLDNVYTIQTLEFSETVDMLPIEKLEIQTGTLKKLWVSQDDHPCSDIFLKIQTCFENLLDSPVFLPYSIQEIPIKNFVPPLREPKDEYLVRDAFFRTIMPINSEGALICGDPNYMIEKLK